MLITSESFDGKQSELGKFDNENEKYNTDSKLIVSKHSLRRADPLQAKNLKSMRRSKKQGASLSPHHKTNHTPRRQTHYKTDPPHFQAGRS